MILKKNHFLIFSLLLSLLCEWGISSNTLAQVLSSTDFQTVAPEKNGFSKKTLKSSVSKIGKMTGVYGVIVIRNGYLSIEQYFRKGTHDKPHNLKSASKSILSALVGIAINKGYLRLDQPISDFIPFIKKLPDPRKNKITVAHLLSMKSGLQSMSYQAYNSWVLNEDWLNKLLKLPIVAEPGTKHQYSTGDSHILSAVLTAATGISTKEFAEKYLFDPMHIPIKGWEVDPQGIYQGGNNLSLYPTDMAKFGQLYLDGGQFNGEQIIPNWWVKESTKKLQPKVHKLYGGYGYLWYSHPGGENAFVAVGYGGQYIYVSPDYHTVIVVISTLRSKGKRWENALFNEIQHGILASIKDSSPKSSNMGPNLRSTQGIATTTLNLRKGPGKKYLIIKTIEPGHIMAIIEKKGAWLQVNASGEKGWVATRFINIVQPENLDIAHLTSGLSQQSVNQTKNVLQELQRSQDKSNSFFKEYEQKQATILANYVSQKEALSPIRKQINSLMESNAKNVTNYSQLKIYLDQIRLSFDQIESQASNLSDKINQQIEVLNYKNQTKQEKLTDDLLKLQTSQNDSKKALSNLQLAESHNAEEISGLRLTNKKHHKQQAAIINELEIIKNNLANNTLDIKKNCDLYQGFDQVRNEQNSSIKQLQRMVKTSGENQISFTNVIDKLRRKIDQERVGKEQLASEIDALKISLKSLFEANKHIRKDFLISENKYKTMATKVLYLIDEVGRQQQIPIQLSVASEKVKKSPVSFEIAKQELISPFISSWSSAWSKQNVAMYFSHYSEEFKPSSGISLKKWQAKRKRNITKPRFIKVTISDVQQEMLNRNNAKVVFKQSYKSNSFSDHVLKTILLRWHKDSWKIIHEKSK